MPGEERIRVLREKPAFSKEQKAALGLVISFGALALVLGGFYIWKHVASPFAITYTGPRFLTADEQEAEKLRKEREADTDSDGVSDYDELYIYKTSAYLADSDSDGVSDRVEIDAGDDPNCAQGAVCDLRTGSQSDLEGSFLDDTADAYRDEASATPTERTLEQTLGDLTPDQVRQLLIEAGGEEAAINALSDDQLMKYFETAIAEAQAAQEQEATQ